MSGDGDQRLRPLQDRHRAVQLAHRGPDARRPHASRPGWTPTGCSSRTARVRARAVRLARRHRARPRQRPGGAARAWRARRRRPSTPTRSTSGSRRSARAAGCACWRRARDRLRRRRGPGPAPRASAAVPPQRHDASPRSTPTARQLRAHGLLLGRRRVRGRRGRRPAPTGSSRTRPRSPYPFTTGDRAAGALRRDRPVDQRGDARERAGLADRARDPRRPAAHLAR